MSSMKRARLVVVLLIVAMFVHGAPAIAGAGTAGFGTSCAWPFHLTETPPRPGFAKLSKVHGDDPHGYFGDVTVSCRG